MAKKRPVPKKDNLQKIEGIGPKIAGLLKEDGIKSFAQLARASVKRLQGILEQAGPRYQMHDPSTWKMQAALAKDQLWEDLEAYQKSLDGGRKTPRKRAAKTAPPKKREGSKREQPPPSATVILTGHGGADYQPGHPFIIERLLSSLEAEQEYQARKEELDEQFLRAKEAIQKLIAPYKDKKKSSGKNETPDQQVCRLIAENCVTAISARYRTKYGQPVSPLSVVIGVNVKRKLPKKRLAASDVLPPEIDGFPVKVVEGEFHLLSGGNGAFLRGALGPANPLPFSEAILGGIPIAPGSDADDFGTLGVIVKEGDDTIGLTCQHVVQGSEGDSILQLESAISMRDIFSVNKVVQPADRNINVGGVVESVDCATVKVKSDGTAVVLPPDGVWTRKISEPGSAEPLVFGNRDLRSRDKRLPLWKFGNGSGELMEGRISILRHDLVVINSLGYENNFSIAREDSGRSFASPGDSGALLAVAAAADLRGERKNCFVIVGILFAALEDSTVGLGCTMVRVLKGLGIKKGDVPTVDNWFART